MARKVYRCSLSVSELNKLADTIQSYADDLPNKMKVLVERLADRGIQIAKPYVQDGYDLHGATNLVVFKKEFENPTPDGCKCIMIMTDQSLMKKEWIYYGKIKTEYISPSMMLEFGSGAYAIDGHRGTFPRSDGKPSKGNQVSWSWMDKKGQWHSSNGIVPTRPLFNTAEQLYNEAISIVKEVFST